MPSDRLSKDQLAALGPNVQLIEAGPGSGKTRTVVERMKLLSESRASGQALISFTNAAADEALRRTTSTGMAHPPNFIGTFDGFLHKYVVTPWYMRRNKFRPSFMQSWDDLGNGQDVIRHSRVAGAGLKLSSFRFNTSGVLVYSTNIPGADRTYVQQLHKAGFAPSDLENVAVERITKLLSQGRFDCDTARLQALHILKSEGDGWLHDRLALRFREIIVDEFQDCSDTEVCIINALKGLGINVVVVADPDQAIYEFRQASPSVYRDFRNSINAQSVVELTTNHRSTPAICEVVTSLRRIGQSAVTAARHEDSTKINILVGSTRFQREKYIELLDDSNIIFSNSIILSHKKKNAAIMAGIAVDKGESSHRTYRILRTVAILRTSKSTRIRKGELQRLSRTILELFDWRNADASLHLSEKRDLLEVTDSDFARLGTVLVSRSMYWLDSEMARSDIIEQTRSSFSSLSRPLKSLKVSLQKLKSDHWTWWESALSDSVATPLPASHIHAVKGREFDAVLLVLEEPRGNQPSTLLDWEQHESTESLRVFYVGASRARKMLSVACPPKSASRLRRLLDSHGIEANWIVETPDNGPFPNECG